MRKLLPQPPDFFFEFFRKAMFRADTIGGITALVLGLVFGWAETVLPIIGAVAVFYGAYDTYRDERVMRADRERVLSVFVTFDDGHPEEFITGDWLTRVYAKINVEMTANEKPVRVSSAILRVSHKKPIWRGLRRARRLIAPLPAINRTTSGLPMVVEPHAVERQEISLEFDTHGSGLLPDRGLRIYEPVMYDLLLSTTSPRATIVTPL